MLYHLIFLCIFFPLSLNAKPSKIQEKNPYESLKQKLIKDGFKEEQIKKIYSNSKTDLALKSVALFFIHSEGRLNYNQFLAKKEINKANKYLKKHAKSFAKIEKNYGVDKTIIAAIMLVETRLGSYLGRSSILNTLSTLSASQNPEIKEKIWNAIPKKRRYERKKFEEKAKKKSKWAYKELKAYLKYTQKENIDPSSIKGSYAGAFGLSQFMPSNALTLARDGNKDGKTNLFDPPDAIASIANYLKHYGWKPGISEKKAYKILYRYNHSKYYVNTLLKVSAKIKEKQKHGS